MPQLIITAVGPDRPGLVGELTGYLLNEGGNIADSRMINLGGRFALILSVALGEAAAERVRGNVAGAGAAIGLSVQVAPEPRTDAGQAAAGGAVKTVGVPYRLKAYAMDQPGIVHRITHLLHTHGVNIEELSTKLEPGSYSGTPLFNLQARLTVPTGLAIRTLRQDLDALCDSLNCDTDLEPA